MRIGSIAVDHDTIWVLTDSDEVYRITSDGDPERAAQPRRRQCHVPPRPSRNRVRRR
jgi:hypothetical protein